MASEPPPAPVAQAASEETTIVVRRSNPVRTVAKWVAIIVAALLVLALAFLVWLNSDPGRRFVVRQINNIEMASGLQVHVDRIEGSIFSELTLHGLRLSDPEGVFFQVPEAQVDYRPLAYLRNHIDIRSLLIPQARLYRLPQLISTDPDAPLLPDIEIDIGRLKIDRLAVDPTITGRPHLLALDSRLRIDEGRAELALQGATIAAPGLPGGDRLALRLDAVPEANKLDIALRLQGPGDGLIAGLAGVDEAIDARIAGNGDWQRWAGRARATLGGQALADLAIEARDGTFNVTGPIRPGLVVAGSMAQLLAPQVQLNLSSSFENRRADLRLRLGSRAIALAADGIVDLGQNRFEGLEVAARITQPGALAPNLSGRDLQVAMILDGPFATPAVAYDLRARSLSFGTTVVEGLRAVGRARVRSDDIVIPVSARADRILGFDAVAGGTLANVRLDGELGVTGARIVSDNLRLRSDRIDALLALALDFNTGRYLAALQGRVNQYLVQSVGLFDLNLDVDMTSQAGGFGLNGRVAARSRRIDNSAIRDLLGGTATASARFDMNPAGLVRIRDVRLVSPLLRVNDGGGVYRPDGGIDLRLSGVSEAYGQLNVHVTGSVSSPQVALEAANPGFGIGLSNISARVRAISGGWAIEATGQSDYGPFSADVVIRSGSGPMVIDINRLTLAGIDFNGTVRQSPAGPFVGSLELAGQGLNGRVTLSAEGRYQRIEVAARADGARIPGEVPILLQRGLIQATAILYPDGPAITGDAQLAGLSSGDLSIERARARVDYRGGSGSAQIFAEGQRGVPFRLAVNAALTPELIRAAADGHVNNIGIRFAQPAQIRRSGSEWILDPVTLLLDQGRVRLAGRYGDGLIIQSRLDGLDLSVLNPFSPGLGLGGRATGSLDFAQPSDGSFPRAEARLNIAGFTRTGIATRSVPVDLALAGALRPEGGRMGAVIRRGGAIIGRLQAQLQPLGPAAGSWTDRLLAAPLSGGIRYNGPANVLMSFANLPEHELTGPIGAAADFSGRVQAPTFNGVLRANALTYTNVRYGTRINQLAIDGRFNASQLEIVQLSGRAGEGSLSGSGRIGLSSEAGFPMDIQLQFANAQLARSDDLAGSATGTLSITNSRERGALIAGELELGEARYRIVRQAAAEVRQLAGVRRRGEPVASPDDVTEDGAIPSIWNLDIRARADNRVFVSGMGLESEWAADLRVEGTTATPRIRGEVDLVRGELSLAGRRFEVTRGHIDFTGSRPPNPLLDLVASTEIEDVEVAVTLSGTASNPQIAFASSPSLPQDEVVSRILFGSSVSEISALQAVQLAASLNTLRGSSGGLNPLGQLRSATGIDRIRILGADETTGRGTAVAAGMYLSDDIYIEIITDARGFTATQLEIALSRALSLLSQFGSTSGNHVNLRYSKDY